MPSLIRIRLGLIIQIGFFLFFRLILTFIDIIIVLRIYQNFFNDLI